MHTIEELDEFDELLSLSDTCASISDNSDSHSDDSASVMIPATNKVSDNGDATSAIHSSSVAQIPSAATIVSSSASPSVI